MSVVTAHPCKIGILAFSAFLLALAGSHYSHRLSPPPAPLPPTAGVQILTYDGIEADRRTVVAKPEVIIVPHGDQLLTIIVSRDFDTGILEGFEVDHLVQWEARGPWEIQLKQPFDPSTSPALRYKARHPK